MKFCVFPHWCSDLLVPELWPLGGSPSWPAPLCCTRLGSGTSRRRTPAREAGAWWRWCGCVCVSSWADCPWTTLEICPRHCPDSWSVRSVHLHTYWCINQHLFRPRRSRGVSEAKHSSQHLTDNNKRYQNQLSVQTFMKKQFHYRWLLS